MLEATIQMMWDDGTIQALAVGALLIMIVAAVLYFDEIFGIQGGK